MPLGFAETCLFLFIIIMSFITGTGSLTVSFLDHVAPLVLQVHVCAVIKLFVAISRKVIIKQLQMQPICSTLLTIPSYFGSSRMALQKPSP